MYSKRTDTDTQTLDLASSTTAGDAALGVTGKRVRWLLVTVLREPVL